MATFSAQVVDLIGAFSDETALDSFITEGANEVINAMPRDMQERVAEETSFTNTTTSEGSKILHVMRNDGTIDQPCRKVPARRRGRIQDSSDMEYATATDPAYYIQDALVTVFPTGTGKLVSIPTYNQGSALDASSLSTITNFPNEAEYLVTTYAAIKALQQNMSGKLGNSDITTALTAINAEIDETLTIADSAATEIGLANAEVDKAFAEVALANTEVDKMAAEVALANAEVDKATAEGALANAEIDKMAAEVALTNSTLDAALTSVGSSVDTATAAIATAAGRVNTAVALANTQFDSAVTANTAEDVELASSHVQAGQGFISEAQAAVSEAQAYVNEVSARVNQVNGESQLAQGYLGSATGYGNIAQGFLGTTSGYIGTAQGYIATANGYGSTGQGYLGTANGYANTAQGYISTANAYLQQIQTKIGISQAYANEAQTRLSVDAAEYSWYEKQQAKLQADYDRGIQLLRAG